MGEEEKERRNYKVLGIWKEDGNAETEEKEVGDCLEGPGFGKEDVNTLQVNDPL